MKLSRLKELRPDVWDEAKFQTIKQKSADSWDYCVNRDVALGVLFTWGVSDQDHKIWNKIDKDEDFTLFDQWLVSQSKGPEPQSKIDLEYWRYKFAGMAMQGMFANSTVYFNINNKDMVVSNAARYADLLIKELQKEKQ